MNRKSSKRLSCAVTRLAEEVLSRWSNILRQLIRRCNLTWGSSNSDRCATVLIVTQNFKTQTTHHCTPDPGPPSSISRIPPTLPLANENKTDYQSIVSHYSKSSYRNFTEYFTYPVTISVRRFTVGGLTTSTESRPRSPRSGPLLSSPSGRCSSRCAGSGLLFSLPSLPATVSSRYDLILDRSGVSLRYNLILAWAALQLFHVDRP